MSKSRLNRPYAGYWYRKEANEVGVNATRP